MQDHVNPLQDRVAVEAHYRNVAIQYEMAKACAHREVVSLSEQGGLRPIKMFRQKDVLFWLERLHPWQRPMDLYHSIFKVDLPLLSANPQEMRKQGEAMKATWLDMVLGYSWFLDLDVYYPPKPVEETAAVVQAHEAAVAQRFLESRTTAVHATEVARDMGLAAYPLFSGTGWNVRVDDYAFTGKPQDAPAAMRALSADVCRQAGIPFVNPKKEKTADKPIVADNSIYDIRRINRIPFTVSSKSGLVVTPLTLGEARNCTLEWFRLDRYVERFEVRDRLKRVNEDASKRL